MGFSGILELYKMYEIHLPTILKLTSALMGEVMNVAEKSKISKKILNPDKVCSQWHETDYAPINFFFFKIFLEKNFVIFGKSDIFASGHFLNGHNFFIKQDSDMEFSGLLERNIMYGITLQPIRNLLPIWSVTSWKWLKIQIFPDFQKKFETPICFALNDMKRIMDYMRNRLFFSKFSLKKCWTLPFSENLTFSLWITFWTAITFSKSRFWYGLFRTVRLW